MRSRMRPVPALLLLVLAAVVIPGAGLPRPHLEVLGIYGGYADEIRQSGRTLADYGVNAVFVGSGSLSADRISRLHKQGVRVFAEFNSMHREAYVKSHPDAAPVGADGLVCPPPEGWQGVCPTHAGYRAETMGAFRAVLRDFEVDGIWLDYHHSHASWERAVPVMPDTCFCSRCLRRFQEETRTTLPDRPVPELSRLLLKEQRSRWVRWRCDVFTGWVREYKQILREVRPLALLGTFHCPWSESDFDGALREKLAIDLRSQARHIDVFSPMPYHARFGHATDPAWISRQTAWLGRHLGIRGRPGERLRIWPIVQLSDWGETVPVEQVAAVIDHGSRLPATGIMVFAWGSLRKQPEKVEALGHAYRALRNGGGRDEAPVPVRPR